MNNQVINPELAVINEVSFVDRHLYAAVLQIMQAYEHRLGKEITNSEFTQGVYQAVYEECENTGIDYENIAADFAAFIETTDDLDSRFIGNPGTLKSYTYLD